MQIVRFSLAVILAAALAPACSSPADVTDDTATGDDDLRVGIVRVYSDASFGGKKLSLAVGDHDLGGTPWNDAVRSLRVFGDYRVELFVDGAYGGTSRIVTADTPDLGALGGQISSIRIRAAGSAGTTPAPTPTPTSTPPSGDPPAPPSSGLVGWAAVAGMGLGGTTGGVGGPTLTVKTIGEFNASAGDTKPAVIVVAAALQGDVAIGSNKTILGAAGGSITGHVEMKASTNVIVRNLKVVGYNCTDNADCQSGADAVTVTKGAHHLWFDHCDVSNGSDGNLDITHASDYVTISWTKFSYSENRPGGHQFSNLIGHSDPNPEDEGHLKVTFHHDWWADNVGERMPRVRYGQVHSFNNLFTATGNNYAFRAGANSKILTENNAFIGVSNPFDIEGGDLLSRGDLFVRTKGTATGTGKAFVPPYAYALEPASAVEAAVRAGAGVR